MDWEAKNVDLKKVIGTEMLGNNSVVTHDLFNAIVNLLLYLKEK